MNAIRKPLERNGRIPGAMLPRRQNDEGSAKRGITRLRYGRAPVKRYPKNTASCDAFHVARAHIIDWEVQNRRKAGERNLV